MTPETKRDEKIDYADPTLVFRLPGKITIISKVLKSIYQTMAETNPVKSLFLPRVAEPAEPAMAEFTLKFSKEVYALEKLIIRSEGNNAYDLLSRAFVIIGKE